MNNKNLKELPYPDVEGMGIREIWENADTDNIIDNFLCNKGDKGYMMVAGFGCVNNCTFCANNKDGYLQRSLESIIEEMQYAIDKFGTDYFVVATDVFSPKWGDVYLFCEKIKQLSTNLGKSLKFAIPMRIHGFNAEIAKELKSAGCRGVYFGLESYDDSVLKSMKKNLKAEEIHRAITICREVGLPYGGCFIFGDPAETTSSYQLTLDFWKEQGRGFSWLIPILLLPGSKLYSDYMADKNDEQRIRFIKNLSNAKSYFSSMVQLSNGMSKSDWDKMMSKILYYRYRYWLYAHCDTIIKDANGYSTVGFQCANCNQQVTRSGITISTTKMIVCPDCGAINDVYRFPTLIFKPVLWIACRLLLHFGVQIIRLKHKLL